MINDVPGWDIENGKYSLLIQLLGALLIGIIIFYIVLAARKIRE
ncbi:MAG: hypothetical protein ACTSRZ_00290 [Promethearchaeota archaeon]